MFYTTLIIQGGYTSSICWGFIFLILSAARITLYPPQPLTYSKYIGCNLIAELESKTKLQFPPSQSLVPKKTMWKIASGHTA